MQTVLASCFYTGIHHGHLLSKYFPVVKDFFADDVVPGDQKGPTDGLSSPADGGI